MTTVSTSGIEQVLRTRLLNYVDPDGHTLGDSDAIGSRLYIDMAPDGTAYPYAEMAIKSPQIRADSDGLVLVADVEVMFFAKPRGQSAPIKALGDRAVAAFTGFRDATSGLLWFTSATAAVLPRFTPPADAGVMQVRVIGRMECYPELLSRLSS